MREKQGSAKDGHTRCLLCVLMRQKGRGSCASLFYKGINPIHEGSTLLIYCPQGSTS